MKIVSGRWGNETKDLIIINTFEIYAAVTNFILSPVATAIGTMLIHGDYSTRTKIILTVFLILVFGIMICNLFAVMLLEE